jgi:uncharacterized protein YggE
MSKQTPLSSDNDAVDSAPLNNNYTYGSAEPPAGRKNPSIAFVINPWWLSALLTVAVLTMLALWRPWQNQPSAENRSVTVTGTATIKAEPDEYMFNPSYDFKNADKKTALNELNAKSAEVVDGLKKLGVTDKDIKTQSNGYEYGYWYDEQTGKYVYTLNLGVNVSNREKAQKIQDYLVGTNPSGQVSPAAVFSNVKQKQLENMARTDATKDARAKADAMAKNLGFTIGKVKSIDDSSTSGRDNPMFLSEGNGSTTADKSIGLSVQPGQNNFDYRITVQYYIR